MASVRRPAAKKTATKKALPHAGFQSDAARVQAAQLHEAEVRMEGNQGSISTHDRHNQGKRDQRT